MRTPLALAFGLFASLAVAQDSADKASEPLKIDKPLETWYRIEQGMSRDVRDHRGWAKETIAPTKIGEASWVYEYQSEGRYERILENDIVTQFVRERVKAMFDPNWELLSLDASVEVDGKTARMEVRADSKGRTADITSLDGHARRISDTGAAPIAYTLAVSLLRERQKGELRTSGNRDIVVLDASFAFDDLKLRRDVKSEGRLHLPGGRKVPVVPVEYRPAGSQLSAKVTYAVLIDRYGRVAEVVGEADCYARSIAADEKDAKPSNEVQEGGRRDPFSKDGALTKKGGAVEERIATAEEVKKLLLALELRAEKIIATAKDDLTMADALYGQMYVEYEVARRQAHTEPVTQQLMDATLHRAHKAVGLWDHERRVAKHYFEIVRAAVDRDDEKESASAIAVLERLPKRILGGREPAPELEKIVADARALAGAITARRELREMKFVLVGASTKQHAVHVPAMTVVCLFGSTFSSTKVQLWVRDEWAIINDTVLRVGEEVPGTGATIVKITQYGCTVAYKGAMRDLVLSK